MRQRLLIRRGGSVAVLCAAALLAGGPAAAPARAADPSPQELWKAYPLEEPARDADDRPGSFGTATPEPRRGAADDRPAERRDDRAADAASPGTASERPRSAGAPVTGDASGTGGSGTVLALAGLGLLALLAVAARALLVPVHSGPGLALRLAILRRRRSAPPEPLVRPGSMSAPLPARARVPTRDGDAAAGTWAPGREADATVHSRFPARDGDADVRRAAARIATREPAAPEARPVLATELAPPRSEATWSPALREAGRATAATLAPPLTSQREHCVIGWQPGDREAHFAALLDGPDGARRPIADSPGFWWPSASPPLSTDASLAAHRRLVERLEGDGWLPAGGGRPWFARRFER